MRVCVESIAPHNVADEGPDALAPWPACSWTGTAPAMRPKAGEQFPRDALHGVNAVLLTVRAEPGQFAGVLSYDLFRDALVFLVPDKNVDAVLKRTMLLLRLWLRRAPG